MSLLGAALPLGQSIRRALHLMQPFGAPLAGAPTCAQVGAVRMQNDDGCRAQSCESTHPLQPWPEDG